MQRVVIGLSGGVDSSVAAYLLKEQGYEVVGLFMINWHDTTGTLEGDCPWHDDRVFAELVARRLDIPFHVVDLSEEYRRRVVDYMFAEYERGRTPNPDVLCNREIKFDVFLKEALRLGADFVATGHYCRRECVAAADGTEHYRLLAGVDGNKDQSYFLCQLSQEQLSRALFPVGGLTKPEVRRIAEEQHLATARRRFFCNRSSRPGRATSTRYGPTGRNTPAQRLPTTFRHWPSRGATPCATARRSASTTGPISIRSASARDWGSAAAANRSSCWPPTSGRT